MAKIVRNGSGDRTLKTGRIGSTAEPCEVRHSWDGFTIVFGGDLSEKMAKIVRNGSGDRTLKIDRIRGTVPTNCGCRTMLGIGFAILQNGCFE